MDNKKSRTLSLTSTILLTIYTVFMVLAEVGLLAICQIMRELSAGGFDMATNSIAAGGNMAEYALPGSVFGSLFAGFGGLAWLVISSFVIFFIVICTVYIAVTAISYVLVKREYYKADAWMKIAVFWNNIPWLYPWYKPFMPADVMPDDTACTSNHTLCYGLIL